MKDNSFNHWYEKNVKLNQIIRYSPDSRRAQPYSRFNKDKDFCRSLILHVNFMIETMACIKDIENNDNILSQNKH